MRGRPGDTERGFALLLVLGVMVVLAAVIARLAGGARVDTRVAHNLVQAARAEALADGGVARAVWAVAEAPEGVRWPADGAVRSFALPEGRLALTIAEESGKIDLNRAPPALVAALFTVLGTPSDEAARLAAAIRDWISPFPPDDPGGTRRAQPYRDAGLAAAPPGAPMEDLAELDLVIGMPKALAAAARPYLTLWTGLAEPQPDQAPPPVRAALDLAASGRSARSRRVAGLFAEARRGGARVLDISATAEPSLGGRFTRRAVLRLEEGPEHAVTILLWGHGSS